jgi:hypothetical protein
MNVPAAYELKRLFPSNRAFFNVLGDVGGIAVASVYHFPDQISFDCAVPWDQCRDPEGPAIRLPHEQVIFELQDDRQFQSLIVFCQQRGSEVESFLIIKTLNKAEWYAPIVRVTFCSGGRSSVTRNISYCPDEGNETPFVRLAVGIVYGALSILARNPVITNVSMPMPQRRKFAKAGVSGWVWHTVSIDPSKLTLCSPNQGGTHASPRWHIRRGHWRNLADGRRIFIRECQVGDMTRGGVVKDYEVAA